MELELAIAEDLVEITFDHLPALQVARLEVESKRLAFRGRRTTNSNNHDGQCNDRLPAQCST
jgi:hypothetical protein